MIYEKVKEACLEKGVSIAWVEQKAGLANGSISKWSKSKPLSTNLISVAHVLEKPVEFFLDDETAEGGDA